MKTIVITVLAALAMAAAPATAVSAQVLNLSGQFQCVKMCAAGPPALAYITQTEWQMNLVNEAGIPSRAWIDYPGHIWVQNWNEGAIYSPDGMIIQFDHERYGSELFGDGAGPRPTFRAKGSAAWRGSPPCGWPRPC